MVYKGPFTVYFKGYGIVGTPYTSLQNAPFGAFCNTFDLHKAIIGLESQVEWPLKTDFTVLHFFEYHFCQANSADTDEMPHYLL